MRLFILFAMITFVYSCESEKKNNISQLPIVKSIDSIPKEQKWNCVDKLINAKYQADIIGVKEILKSNCNFSDSSNELIEILFWGSKNNYKEIIKLVIDLGISPNIQQSKESITLLSYAVRYRDQELIEFLLLKGADILMTFSEEFEDCQLCPNQITVLHQLVISACDISNTQDIEILDFLLSKTKNRSSKNGQGFTVYNMLEFCENSKLASTLKKYAN